MSLQIRTATPDDLAPIVALVHELAAYVGGADDCRLDRDALAAALFPAREAAALHALVAVDDARPAGAEVVGTAIWFRSFSTWEGRHGLYLEDLIVRADSRGTGAGRALLARLARICVDEGWPRLTWEVLRSNTAALEFYRRLGSRELEGQVMHRLAGDALAELATMDLASGA